jgi:ketosteroid isomerase-like protein
VRLPAQLPAPRATGREVIVFLSSLIVFGGVALAPAAADGARESVVCAEVSFSRAAERRDLGSFTSLIDEEARFVTGSVLRGPDAITSAWASYFEPDGPEIRWRPAIVEVVADGTLALSRGPYRIRAQDAQGTSTEAWGTFNSVWRRQPDGEWKVLFDAGGDHGKTPTAEERQVLEAEPNCG